MKKIFVFLLFLIALQTRSTAQISVSQNANASQLAQTLAGAGVTISNASFTGNSVASGTFSNAPNALGINNGVVLTSGSVLPIPLATGAAGIAGNTTGFPNYENLASGDVNLNSVSIALGESFTTLDATILEFDLVVQGDSLVFDYVFGSEEYTDGSSLNFVCSNFGDVFGFFISGPNPAGGSYNNRNIALIPNTNTPITVNTVNNGISGGNNTANTCILTNTAYFNGAISGMTYNGFTTVFQAIAQTVPCQTYHIKLAVADGDDRQYDSGVFLREGSFTSIGTTISGSTANVLQSNTAVEGCVDANFTFTIPTPLSTNFVINYSIGGTATNGVDYASIPNQTTIPAGQTSATINISPIEDNLPEGTETIIVYLMHPCNPGVIIDSAIINVNDNNNLNFSSPNDTTICPNTPLSVSASGGTQYIWTPQSAFASPNSATTQINATSPQYLHIEVIDANGCSTVDSFYLDFYPQPTAYAGEDTSVCLNINDAVVFNTSVPLQATGGLSYLWTPNVDLSSNTIANPIASPSVNTNYVVEVTDANGCKDTDTVLVTVLNPGIELIQLTIDSLCIGDTVYVDVLDQGTITNYSWSPNTFVTNPNVREPGFFPITNTFYTLSVQNYCYLKQDSILIEVISLPTIDAGPLDSICMGETNYQLNALPTNYEIYEWTSTDNSISNTSIPNPLISPTTSSWYHLSVVDSIGSLACKNKDSVQILVFDNPITQIDFPLGYLGYICQGNSVNLQASSNDGINYLWDNSPYLNPLNNATTSASPIDTTTFYVNVTNQHDCTTRDSATVNVQKPIAATLFGDSIMCVNEYVDIEATDGLYFHWYPEAIFSNIHTKKTQASPDTSMTIFVHIENDCFDDTLSKFIEVKQLPFVDAGMDKTINRDDVPAILDGAGDGKPLWYTSERTFDGILDAPTNYTPKVSPFNTTNYVLEIENPITGCKNYDTATVFVKVLTLIALPTGFSPNGDGVNDLFKGLKHLNIKSVESFSVYNRYGERVYLGEGFKAAWDGTYKGTKADIGVYIYTIQATTKDGKEIKINGNITLIQ